MSTLRVTCGRLEEREVEHVMSTAPCRGPKPKSFMGVTFPRSCTRSPHFDMMFKQQLRILASDIKH